MTRISTLAFKLPEFSNGYEIDPRLFHIYLLKNKYKYNVSVKLTAEKTLCLVTEDKHNLRPYGNTPSHRVNFKLFEKRCPETDIQKEMRLQISQKTASKSDLSGILQVYLRQQSTLGIIHGNIAHQYYHFNLADEIITQILD